MSFRLLMFAVFVFALPSISEARFSAMDYNIRSQTFCGLLEDGRSECLGAGQFREPALLSGDTQETYSDLEIGKFFNCGITTSGVVSCWGDGEEGQLDVPEFDTAVVKLEAADFHACAIDSGNTLKCWGQGSDGSQMDPNSLQGYIDVSTQFREICALRTDGGIDCWFQYPDLMSRTISGAQMMSLLSSPLISLEHDFTRYCGVQAAGSAVCVINNQGMLSTQGIFSNGPYAEVFAGRPEFGLPHCALTSVGELDCVNDESGTVTRDSGLYRALAYDSVSTCRFTIEDRLECSAGTVNSDIDNRQFPAIEQTLNGERDIPTVEFTSAESYGSAVELFFDSSESNTIILNAQHDVQIFRDGELLQTTNNNASYFDNTAEPGREYVYTARHIHLYGQTGEFSTPITVNTANNSAVVSSENNNASSDRLSSPTGLRTEIYYFDIELFWDRNFSGAVRNYEIRRDGELVSSTRGTSYYDGTTTSGELYVYDVIAVGHDDNILGFESVRVQIGETQCSI